MTLLAVDTSGPFCSAALYDCVEQRVIGALSEEIGRGHAERLWPMLNEVLGSANLTWSDITRLAVVNGPGSFTGLRVGIASARGLALARGIPCNGVSVFEAMVQACGQTGPLAVAMDAKRGEVWFQCFEKTGQAESEPIACSVTDAANVVREAEIDSLVGSGAHLLLSEGDWSAKPTVLAEHASPPIEAVARHAGRQLPSLAPPVPLYLRAPDAKPQNASLVK